MLQGEEDKKRKEYKMLTVCSKGHEEIAYTCQFCPLCDVNNQLDDAQDDLIRVEDDYQSALLKIKELEIELEPEQELLDRNEDDPRKDR